MKRTGLLLFAVVLALRPGMAQKKHTEEVIYLKNGSIIRQAVSLQHRDSLIEVQTSGGTLIRFAVGELDRVVREPVRQAFRLRGFYIGFDAGLGVGRGYMDLAGNDARETNFFLHAAAGHHWNAHWATGGGAGLDIYGTATFVPVFGRVQYTPLSGRVSPVAVLDLGYGLLTRAFNGEPAPSQTVRGGLFLNPAVGFLVHTGRRTAFTFTAGYRHQAYTQAQDINEMITVQEVVMRRMSIRLGWAF